MRLKQLELSNIRWEIVSAVLAVLLLLTNIGWIVSYLNSSFSKNESSSNQSSSNNANTDTDTNNDTDTDADQSLVVGDGFDYCAVANGGVSLSEGFECTITKVTDTEVSLTISTKGIGIPYVGNFVVNRTTKEIVSQDVAQ